MSILRIVYGAAILLAVVFAFVPMSNSALLLAILGAVASFAVLPEHHVRVILSALALTALAGTFNGIPSLGMYITSILANLGVAVAGAAVMIILRNMVNRLINWA